MYIQVETKSSSAQRSVRVTSRSHTLPVIAILVNARRPSDTRPRPRKSASSALLILRDHHLGRARGRDGSCRRRRTSRTGADGPGAAAVQKADDSIVSRVLREIGIPQTRLPLARKGGRDPGVLVREIPEGDADAGRGRETRGHGARVVSGLLGEAGRCGREAAEADVELGAGKSVRVPAAWCSGMEKCVWKRMS